MGHWNFDFLLLSIHSTDPILGTLTICDTWIRSVLVGDRMFKSSLFDSDRAFVANIPS